MDLYATTSYELAERLTSRYSTSFSWSSRLFDRAIRPHIFAIYGMVRLADEIVDTYRGDDAAAQLNALHAQVRDAIARDYSTNPLLHAFALTARRYDIGDSLIDPFFESMAADLSATSFDQAAYERYIYGSAEVIGLMCLRVFVDGDDKQYDELADGARHLGSAYQKVNFLRDIAADHDQLGRMYFPDVTYDTFDDDTKQSIIDDIEADFAIARRTIPQLPPGARKAVHTSYLYYHDLLQSIRNVPAATLLTRRVRLPNWRKAALLGRARLGL